MTGIKTTSADQWFSRCVRERAEWKCERCGTQYDSSAGQGLDCSHYYSRADQSIRHYPLNAMAHCRGCHQWLSGRPEEFRKLWHSVYGDSLDELLINRANLTRGRAIKRSLKAVAKHYREQYDQMQALRECGARGRIEFEDVPWEEF